MEEIFSNASRMISTAFGFMAETIPGCTRSFTHKRYVVSHFLSAGWLYGGNGKPTPISKRKRRRNRILRLNNNNTVPNYLLPRIASLAALATRNLTTRLAAILMVSPVAGFRPMRALRFTRTILPSPGIVKEFFAFLYARATSASMVCTACFLVSPTVSASDAAICDFDNAFAIIVSKVDSGRTQ